MEEVAVHIGATAGLMMADSTGSAEQSGTGSCTKDLGISGGCVNPWAATGDFPRSGWSKANGGGWALKKE